MTTLHRSLLVVTVSALVAAAAAVVVAPARPAAASPIEENFSITLAGAFGNKTYTPDNYKVGVSQSNQTDRQELTVSVLDRSDNPQMHFKFTTQVGSKKYLAVGYYGDAQGGYVHTGRSGVDVGHLDFCSDVSGNFEVRDIRTEGLSITRLWITYQRFCRDLDPAFGEIRLGYPKTAYDVSPRVVRWPAGTEPNESADDVPVTVRRTGSGAVTITSVSVVGRYANEFPIRQNGCTGALSAQGCVVQVGFAPHDPGPRHAKLRIVTSAGTTFVSLDGSGALGQTNWSVDLDWDSDSESTPDEHHDFPNSYSWGNPYELNSGAYGDDSEVWQASFSLPWKETFSRGHYVLQPDGSGLHMSASIGTGACVVQQATADIADIAFTGLDQKLSLLDLTMDAHCESGYSLRGRLKFHDRDDLTAPARVTNLTGVRDGLYLNVHWTNPTATDLDGVIVRWYPGRLPPAVPDVGEEVYIGTGPTVRFSVPTTTPIAVGVWPYDKTGNIGSRLAVVVSP